MADEPVVNPGAAQSGGDGTTPPVTPPVETPPAAEPTGSALTEGATPAWYDAMPEDMRDAVKGFESREAFEAALKGPEIPEGDYTVPEGLAVDAEVMKQFTPLAKELGLDQAKVEKLLAFDAARMGNLPAVLQAQQAEAMKAGLADMAAELGQEKYDATMASARLAVNTFVDDDTKKWLNETQQGNNPVLIKLFAKIGAKLQEDSPKGGAATGGSPKEKSLGDRLYPSMAEQNK